MPLKKLQLEIKKLANPKKAKILMRFFKTGKGQYGEGDKFLGIVVPKQRELVKKYWHNLTLADLDVLIKSNIHEERLIALLILVAKYQNNLSSSGQSRGSMDSRLRGNDKKAIFKFYLSHTKYINNWDLVDLSAPNIVGSYLYSLSLEGREAGVRVKNQTLLRLAKSKNLWERRIAILATFAFIKKKQTIDIIKIAAILLKDKHDLIHKAVGWMLREVGKRCGEKTLTKFLDANALKMPRTALRYAIERLPKEQRLHYLHLK